MYNIKYNMDDIRQYGYSSLQDTRTRIILPLHQKYIIILLCYKYAHDYLYGVWSIITQNTLTQ